MFSLPEIEFAVDLSLFKTYVAVQELILHVCADPDAAVPDIV